MCFFLWADQARIDRFLIFWIEKNVFLTRKVMLQKSLKNRNFPKGLVYNLCDKIELFNMYVFWANLARIVCLIISWRHKNAFQTRKVKFPKVQKKRKFSKGYSTVFDKNSSFSPCVFFVQMKPQKIVFLILWIEKNDFQTKKSDVSKKVQKIAIFQRVKSMVFVKKSNLLPRVFVGQIKPEKIVF